jgi:hypothetical protein
MGTDKVALAGSDHCKWPEVTSPVLIGSDVSHVTGSRVIRALSGSMACACATRSCAISALVAPFDRKWRESRDRKMPYRKQPWPEVCSAHARIFPAFFFLTRVVGQFWSEVTSDWRHRKGSCPEVCSTHAWFFPRLFLSSSTKCSSNNKTLIARVLARVITGCHFT